MISSHSSSVKFFLPFFNSSMSTWGIWIAAARAALLAETGAQVFFSHELCARYFTYTDREGAAHFVLFDDADTLAAKLAQLTGCGVQTVFALYPDAAGLIPS